MLIHMKNVRNVNIWEKYIDFKMIVTYDCKRKELIKMDKISDSELIELVKQGNENAYEELYQRFHRLAFYYAYKLCKNDADAKDIVQECFLEIHRSINSLKENSFFKAWMYKIVSSKCKKLFRKNKHITNDFEDDVMVNNVKEDRIEFIPEQLSHFKNDQDLLNTFIDQLPNAQSSIVVLFYLEQFSLKEISDILDIPIGTVKSRLSYARMYLKKALDSYRGSGEEPLSFHAFDAALAFALTTSFAAMKPPVIKLKGKKLQFHGSSNILLNVAMGSLAVTVVGAGAAAYQNLTQMPNRSIPENVSTQTIGKNTSQFHSITVLDEIIDNPQDAYFSLIEWACCEEMLNQKTKEELSSYQPLYEELKAYGGPFYERLVEKQWASIYELKQSK